MSLALVSLLNADLFAFPLPGLANLLVTVQASTPEEMLAGVRKALDEVIARNVLIVADPGLGAPAKLTIQDASLAGGGDGHTFVLSINFVPAEFNLVHTFVADQLADVDLSPEFWMFDFIMAGDAESLAPLYSPMAQRLAGEFPFALGLLNMFAGSAKGTRFMMGIGAIQPQLGDG